MRGGGEAAQHRHRELGCAEVDAAIAAHAARIIVQI
jgi:hypothetical protein